MATLAAATVNRGTNSNCKLPSTVAGFLTRAVGNAYVIADDLELCKRSSLT